MTPKQRLDLISAIAQKLQNESTVSKINILFDSYKLDYTKLPSVTSKKNYVESALGSQQDDIILMVAEDLDVIAPERSSQRKSRNDIMADHFSNQNENKKQEMSNAVKKVFVSHSSLDKDIVRKFVDILKAIGLKHNQIFCSSLIGYDIDLGDNFLDALKRELNNDVIVIFLLSENFFKSDICMCEMGASWLTAKQIIQVLIPPFQFQDIKGVFRLSQSMILTDKGKLNSLRDKMESFFGINHTSSTIWEEDRESILQDINRIVRFNTDKAESEKKIKEMVEHSAYIEKTRKKENDIVNYFLKPLRKYSSSDIDRSMLAGFSLNSLEYINERLKMLEDHKIIERNLIGGVEEDEVHLPLKISRTGRTLDYLDKGILW